MSDASTRPPEPSPPRGSWLWPGLIFVLLGAHVLLVVVTILMATRDPSFAVEPDYYQKGLHWNDIVQQNRQNARLGWKLALDLGEESNTLGERTITCQLTDPAGHPLDGAQIDLVAFPFARGNQRASVLFEPQEGGRYRATIRLSRPGQWEFRFVVRRGPDTFTYVEQRQV